MDYHHLSVVVVSLASKPTAPTSISCNMLALMDQWSGPRLGNWMKHRENSGCPRSAFPLDFVCFADEARISPRSEQARKAQVNTSQVGSDYCTCRIKV